MANVGPSSPAELGALGAQLAAEGISVATVGLGTDYNEDLMVELAVRSDGSHAFVQHAADLARFLDQELGAVDRGGGARRGGQDPLRARARGRCA